MFLSFTVILICVFSIRFDVSGQVFKVGFIKEYLCHFQERMENDLMRISVGTPGDSLACSRVCMYDEDCAGFSLASNHDPPIASPAPARCYLHKDHFTHERCTAERAELSHAYYRKYGVCYNGGTWDEDKGKCICEPSSLKVGHLCTSHPRSCWDLAQAGYVPYRKKTLSLQPLANAPQIDLSCTVSNDGSTATKIGYNHATLRQHVVNTTWFNYENGIGINNEDSHDFYWLGLKYIRGVLLASGSAPKLTVIVTFRRFPKVVPGAMTILNVGLSGASDGYRLTYSGHEQTDRFTGIADFCFRDSDGVRFSTYDADHDRNASANCAAINGAGGWFHSCDSPCNLFGIRYTHMWTTNSSKYPFSLDKMRISAITKDENSYTLPFVDMEIRTGI